jgi:hypothetical protein
MLKYLPHFFDPIIIASGNFLNLFTVVGVAKLINKPSFTGLQLINNNKFNTKNIIKLSISKSLF